MSRFDTLVVTTDFSETSRRALAPALAIARRFGSTVVVVHVVEDRLPAFVDEFAAIPLEEILESQARRAAQELTHFLEPYAGSGVPLERVVLRSLEVRRYNQIRGGDGRMSPHGDSVDAPASTSSARAPKYCKYPVYCSIAEDGYPDCFIGCSEWNRKTMTCRAAKP